MASEITEWTNWSAIHIQSAAYFARQAAQVEKQAINQGTDMSDANVSIALHANSTGAVFLSVAFLEATVNELFIGARTEPRIAGSLADQLDAESAATLARAWDKPSAKGMGKTQDKAIKDKATLPKYEDALTLLGKKTFDEAVSPYEDARRLIGLRNSLIHYKPEWRIAFSRNRPEEVEPLDLAGRFPISPTLPKSFLGESFHRYIGHGLAQWAVKSSFELSEQFHSCLGLKPAYDYDRARIKTE